MTEKELLAQYHATGDLNTLGKLYAPYMSLLYGVCYKYFQDSERSNDAVMQIFEELIQKLKIHKVDNFKSWLHVYAKNFCLMALRKDKKVRQVDIELHFVESEQQLHTSEDLRWEDRDFEQLEECLSRLNIEQERCVRMFYLEKKCYKDIAAEIGIDLNKVKSAIQNGKRNLKICMESKK